MASKLLKIPNMSILSVDRVVKFTTRRKQQLFMDGTSSKILLAFDFDRTITKENTDFIAFDMLPDEEERKKLWCQIEKGKWSKFMNMVFGRLKDHNISLNELKSKIEQMPLIEGMQEMFDYIASNKDLYDCIIISDSNSWFINSILEKNNLKRVVSQIFTNPATLSENQLSISPCHSHNHLQCPSNMCKGQLLTDYIHSSKVCGTSFKSISYFGDGGNDFCPCNHLGKNDFVFPRRGYELEKKLISVQKSGNTIQAQIVPWDNGYQILDRLLLLK